MFSKILLPIANTPLSERAAQLGIALAQRIGAQTVVVHATDRPSSAEALDLLERFRPSTTAENANRALEPLLAHSSDPIRAIIDAAQAHACDLIVMGTHAREGLPRLLLGSVAEQVLRQSPLPVMLLRDAAQAPFEGNFQRLLIPVDGGVAGQVALETGIELARRLGAALILLHVVPEPMLLTGDFIGVGYVMPDWQGQHSTLKREGEALLASALARCGALKAETRLVPSLRRDVGTVILEVSKAEGVDLVIMGTHGRQGLERLLLGSVAEQVAHHAETPVLLARSIPASASQPAHVRGTVVLPHALQHDMG